MASTAIVTGGGSGVGQEVALLLAREGWNVSILGRRPEPLRQTLQLAGDAGDRMLPLPCDVGDASKVSSAVAETERQFGAITALIAAAGINIPRRSWEELTAADYRAVIDANLHGVFNCVHAVLPGMRSAGRGTIVAIVSDAGMQASPKAGPAYVASKFGLRGLCQSINAEERSRGIRCTGIFPGDINTPILEKRPTPPGPEARSKMLQPEDIAACVLLALNLPDRAVIEELLIRPR
jgi:NAD(P)-dependent dehydrogenase (short-subunit alcohol dehydrogenase family)